LVCSTPRVSTRSDSLHTEHTPDKSHPALLKAASCVAGLFRKVIDDADKPSCAKPVVVGAVDAGATLTGVGLFNIMSLASSKHSAMNQ
jgi:hypothetical protein